MPTTDTSQSTPGNKPLVFISCGQYTPKEKELGKAIERLVKDTTPYDAYFAEVQNSLEGLATNIFLALQRSAAFVAIAHYRGMVQQPAGESVRASVWIEQEVAIAAFIQHALKRRIEVALYLQKGIRREGIREQLRLAPVEFETEKDVLEDFQRRIAGWNLLAPSERSLVAQWRFEAVGNSPVRHDYRLFVDLVNNGTAAVNDWRIRAEIPRAFVRYGQGESQTITIDEDSASLLPEEAKLYPGDRKRDALVLAYQIDESNKRLSRTPEAAVTISIWSGDMTPVVQRIPLSEITNH